MSEDSSTATDLLDDLFTSTHSGTTIVKVFANADDGDPYYIDALDFFNAKAQLERIIAAARLDELRNAVMNQNTSNKIEYVLYIDNRYTKLKDQLK